MGSSKDNKAGKGKSATSKNLDLPTKLQQTPTAGSTRPTTTPAMTLGNSAADVATAIDTGAKTLLTSNASNVQTTPRIPVKRPHDGSVIPNASRTKASDQASAVKSRTPSKIDGRPVDKPQPAKATSEQAKDDESDEIESLFAAYRPVDGIGAARQSSTNPLTRGLNPVELIMTSNATSTSNVASEASRSAATTFGAIGVLDTTTGANKAIASIENPTSLFGGPNTTNTPPKGFFTAPNSSPTKSLPLFGVTSTLGRPEQKSNTSGASTLPIDFSTAPTPNPATASPFGVLKMPETASTPNPAIASQFSVLSMLDTAPTSNPTTESPFGGLKMAGTASTTNPATESPFASLGMADTAPTPNSAIYSPFSSSKAPSTAPLPNPATTSPFGLLKLPHTAPGPNPVIASLFGAFEAAPEPIPPPISPFNVVKMFETARIPNPATTNPFGASKMAETAHKPTNSTSGVFNIADTARTPNWATNSQFGVFSMADTARTPHSETKSLFSTVKTPSENIFSKSNFPTSDIGDSQAKGLFGNLSEQARQSKSNSFDFGPSGSSPHPFAATKLTDSLETCTPAIFNESKLPPIKPDFNPEMAIDEGLSNIYQPMVPYGHHQSKDHSLSSPFKSLQTDDALPSANITGNSTTQKPGNQFGSPFDQTTNEMTSRKFETLITYQKHAIQELRSSKAWLSEQNELVSRNLAISTENLGLCGAQLQYFSKRCNDLNEICKERREECAKLQEELDKVIDKYEAKNQKANLALGLFKREKYTSLSRYAFCVYILVCILVTWLAMSVHKWVF